MTGQLSPYRRSRESPRSGRRRASSVPTGGTEPLPENGRRRASSVPLAPTEPFPEVEGDRPAQSLQPQQSLSKKWKETGQLSPYRWSRESPRSGRIRASSVPTAPTEPLQEVEGDGPAQSLKAKPSLSQKRKETGQLSPSSPNRAFPRSEGDRPAQSLQPQQSLSKKWKETGQLSLYRRNRASPRSGRRRASSVLTAPKEPLQEVEGDGPAQSLHCRTEPLPVVDGDGPAQSLQPQPSLSKKWKETGQLSPYSPNQATPRSGRRRASSVLTGGTEPLQELEGYGPAQSLQPQPTLSKKWEETGHLSPYSPNRATPRSGRRRARSVLTAPTEPLQEVEGDGPAQSLQAEPSLSKKRKETGQLSLYRRNRASPRSGRRRASSVLTGGPSLTKKWKETGQLSPYSLNLASTRSGRRRASSVPTAPTEPLQEVEGDGPGQSLQAEPSLSKKWKATGHLSPNRRTDPLLEVEGDGPAQSLQAEPRISKKWKETGQLSPYRRTEPHQEVEGDGPAQSLQPQPSLYMKWKETGQLSPYSPNRASPRGGRRRARSVLTGGTEPLQEVEGDGPSLSQQAEPSLS